MGILTPADVAKLLDVTEQTLAQWRSEKRGPNYTRLGKGVFYRADDLQKWIAANVVEVSPAVA